MKTKTKMPLQISIVTSWPLQNKDQLNLSENKILRLNILVYAQKKKYTKATRRYHCQHASIQHELTARRTVVRNVHFTANCSINVLKIAPFPPIFRHLFKPVEWNLFNNFNFATKCSKNMNILYVCVWVGVLLCVCFLARKKKASFNKQLPFSVSVFAVNARARVC